MSPGDLRVVAVSAPEAGSRAAAPLHLCAVPAGFPSPAGDYVEGEIDLNEWLVRNRLATYFVRVEGDSMADGIRSGDLLVIDRSLDARHGDVVVACLEGEMTVRRLVLEGGGRLRLMEAVDGINRRHGRHSACSISLSKNSHCGLFSISFWGYHQNKGVGRRHVHGTHALREDRIFTSLCLEKTLERSTRLSRRTRPPSHGRSHAQEC